MIPAEASLARIAGSGDAGLRDGPALQAQFLLPSALVFDSRGNLYIADAAAQRIRVLGTDGIVRTIAGSGALDSTGLNVPGGYKDGPALQARFNHPSGIAVAPNGDVFVADTKNHVIRLISRGMVSTFSGDAREMGSADGSLQTARFAYPHQLALDRDVLYVADYGNGIRRIAGDSVSTFHKELAEKRITGVAIGSGGGAATLYVADVTGLSAIDLISDKIFNYRVDAASTEGFVNVGQPYSLAAAGAHSVVFTDLRNDEVKALVENNLQFITPSNPDDVVLGAASSTSGGTPVHGPLAVAVRGKRIVIANAGRRDIITAAAPAGIGITAGEFSDALFPADAFRIALLSNSPAYFSQTDDNSIAHYIDESLKHARLPHGARSKTVFFRDTFPGSALEITSGLLSKGVVDCVVLVVNSDFYSVYHSGPPSQSLVDYSVLAADSALSQKYSLRLSADLSTIYRELRRNNVCMLLAAMPFPWDLGPSGDLFSTENLHNLERDAYMQPPYYDTPLTTPRVTDFTRVEQNVMSTLRKSGAPVLDLWPVLRAVEKKTPGILFPTEDLHFSPAGREIVGEAIGREIARRHLWSAQRNTAARTATSLSQDEPVLGSPGSIPPAPMAQTPVQPPSAMRSPSEQGTLMPDWTPIPGSASRIAASPDGSIWVLGTLPAGPDKYIWHYAHGVWTNISGLASELAVAPNGTLYAANSDGGAYAYSNGRWNAVGGGIAGIAVAAGGAVYVLSGDAADKPIWRNAGGKWSAVSGAGVVLTSSADPAHTLYVLNSAGAIYYVTANGAFAQLAGTASQIAPAAGRVFALGFPPGAAGSPLLYFDAKSESWKALAGSGLAIATDGSTLYVIGSNGAIYATSAAARAKI